MLYLHCVIQFNATQTAHRYYKHDAKSAMCNTVIESGYVASAAVYCSMASVLTVHNLETTFCVPPVKSLLCRAQYLGSVECPRAVAESGRCNILGYLTEDTESVIALCRTGLSILQEYALGERCQQTPSHICYQDFSPTFPDLQKWPATIKMRPAYIAHYGAALFLCA